MKDKQLVKTQCDFETAIKGLFEWFDHHVKCDDWNDFREKFMKFAGRYAADTMNEIINIKEKNNDSPNQK